MFIYTVPGQRKRKGREKACSLLFVNHLSMIQKFLCLGRRDWFELKCRERISGFETLNKVFLARPSVHRSVGAD